MIASLVLLLFLLIGSCYVSYVPDEVDVVGLLVPFESCLIAITSLLEMDEVDPKQIGILEVGSETVIDKRKSIKTFLIQIFEEM